MYPHIPRQHQYKESFTSIVIAFFALLALVGWVASEMVDSIEREMANRAMVDLEHAKIVNDYRELKPKYISRAELMKEWIEKEMAK